MDTTTNILHTASFFRSDMPGRDALDLAIDLHTESDAPATVAPATSVDHGISPSTSPPWTIFFQAFIPVSTKTYI